MSGTGSPILFPESSVRPQRASGSGEEDEHWVRRSISILTFRTYSTDMLVPAALWFVYNKLIMMPPQGSIILDAGRVCAIAIKNRSWDAAKPSVIEATLPVDARPKGYQTWDDEFIPELKQTISVSKVGPLTS